MKIIQVSKYPDTWVWILGYWYYPTIQCLDTWIVGYLIFYVSRYLDTQILGYHGYLDTWILGYSNFFRIWIMDSQKSLDIQVSGYPSIRISKYPDITSLDKLKPKTKTKNQNIFCWCKWKFDDFFIHFE